MNHLCRIEIQGGEEKEGVKPLTLQNEIETASCLRSAALVRSLPKEEEGKGGGEKEVSSIFCQGKRNKASRRYFSRLSTAHQENEGKGRKKREVWFSDSSREFPTISVPAAPSRKKKKHSHHPTTAARTKSTSNSSQRRKGGGGGGGRGGHTMHGGFSRPRKITDFLSARKERRGKERSWGLLCLRKSPLSTNGRPGGVFEVSTKSKEERKGGGNTKPRSTADQENGARGHSIGDLRRLRGEEKKGERPVELGINVALQVKSARSLGSGYPLRGKEKGKTE